MNSKGDNMKNKIKYIDIIVFIIILFIANKALDIFMEKIQFHNSLVSSVIQLTLMLVVGSVLFIIYEKIKQNFILKNDK